MLNARRLTLFTLLLAFAATPALAQLPATALEGTWEMVSQKLIYPDSTVDRGRYLGPSFKLLNSTHFAFGRQTFVNGEAQDDVYAGGGRYELVGDTVYVEYIEYHSDQALVGLSLSFRARIEGDLWYHIGDIGNFRLEEVWRRVP